MRSFVEFTRPRYVVALRIDSSSADNTDNNRRALYIEPKHKPKARRRTGLKAPCSYAIGTIAALFLHLLLPEDRVLDEEKEHYPRAFSDGEIAYET